jgi:purine-nucleoside phosphorylase
MGIEVLAFSIITDECYPDALKPLSIEEIIEAANISVSKLTFLISEIIRKL